MAGNEVRLRRIESPDDLAPANELAREFGDWATKEIRVQLGIVVPTGADHPIEVLDELLAAGGRLYVAEVDGVAVGVGGLRRLTETTGEIKRMFVRPTARGLGVGRAIVERLIDDARVLGFETIYLESASFMHSAHTLYRSVGFGPSGPYPGREFEGVAHDVSILMRARPGLAEAPLESRARPVRLSRQLDLRRLACGARFEPRIEAIATGDS